jgi:hypothetical protein
MAATEIETNFPAVDSARRARQFSDVLVGLGVAVWFMMAAVPHSVSRERQILGMVGGVLIGAFAFLRCTSWRSCSDCLRRSRTA